MAALDKFRNKKTNHYAYWERTDYIYSNYCSSCRYKHDDRSNFCPNCGAIMLSKEEYESKISDNLVMYLLDRLKNGEVIPDETGRLIDGDALEIEVENGIKAANYEEGYDNYGHINSVDDCLESIKYADTILESTINNREV